MAKINWKEVLIKTNDFIHLSLKKYAKFLLRLSPHQNVAQAILVYMFIGWIILSMPFMTKGHVSLLDNLFTAAAAVSTAGMATVNFADSYTLLGKIVVLILIQIGGVGYMTFASFVFLSLSQKHRLRKSQEEALSAEVKLPNTLKLSDFLWAALVFTFIAESIGTIFFFNYFKHHDFSNFQAAWYAVFHSVSSFCTAGYSLWNDSLIHFADSKTINILVSILSLSGAMGFIVVADIFNFIRRKTKEISFTTKIIVLTTLSLVLFGTFTLFVTSPGLSLWEAFFQSVAAITTTGFYSVDIAELSVCSLLILMLMMSIGGSPSGTAGGFKTTAFSSVLALVYNRLRMHNRVEFLGRRIPIIRLYEATSSILLYTVFLFLSIFLLSWTEKLSFLDLVFESAAALSTSGLSTGITPQLTWMGKFIIIATMLIGRIGVVTFSMALLAREDEDEAARNKPTTSADIAI